MQWGGALPRRAGSPGAWRSTFNLFAVIAVRVYTLESSNSLFYFSHHEGDHLSSCLCPPPHTLCQASGLSQSTRKHKHIFFFFLVAFPASHLHPGSVTALRHLMRCQWGWPQQRHIKGKICQVHQSKVTEFSICWLFFFPHQVFPRNRREKADRPPLSARFKRQFIVAAVFSMPNVPEDKLFAATTAYSFLLRWSDFVLRSKALFQTTGLAPELCGGQVLHRCTPLPHIWLLPAGSPDLLQLLALTKEKKKKNKTWWLSYASIKGHSKALL